MASALLAPPSNTSPESALHLSQAAPSFFASQASFNLPWPLSLLSASESQEKWQIYNNIFIACLASGDSESAYLCLEEITDRFGKENERVMALNGLYQEATAKNDTELQAVLGRYEELLQDDPTLFAVRKRRAALLRSMGRTNEAVAALTELLDASPIDAESWAELADVYLTQGLYEQAIFSLEEVLLVTPNAWNIHARLGEVLYLNANHSEGAEQVKGLSEAMRRFCRCIELCDDYLRGYYGLKLTTSRLLPLLSASSQKTSTAELPPPSVKTTEKLNEAATAKLSEIVRRSKSGEKGFDGYSEAELIAAHELLSRDSQNVAR
ncbi:hypothetical protein WHR41_02974 [Cladosporium halotolerans]|uniref:ER membrane protein complex subunit 2 n=1 Tax=Cladosporium halotolerans TaxID=1052096 RepID=A0AB34KTL9_9PEZI